MSINCWHTLSKFWVRTKAANWKGSSNRGTEMEGSLRRPCFILCPGKKATLNPRRLRPGRTRPTCRREKRLCRWRVREDNLVFNSFSVPTSRLVGGPGLFLSLGSVDNQHLTKMFSLWPCFNWRDFSVIQNPKTLGYPEHTWLWAQSEQGPLLFWFLMYLTKYLAHSISSVSISQKKNELKILINIRRSTEKHMHFSQCVKSFHQW